MTQHQMDFVSDLLENNCTQHGIYAIVADVHVISFRIQISFISLTRADRTENATTA